MLGYRTRRIALSNTEQQRIEINLQPNSIRLNEITVTPLSPEDIVRKALQKVPVNYSTVPLLYKGFYRETVQKRRQFISISEAVVDVYKTPYTMQNTNQDAVAITRGRRLLNMKPADTLGVKLMGGPTMPVIADVLKNNEMLFYEDDMPNYHFELTTSTARRPNAIRRQDDTTHTTPLRPVFRNALHRPADTRLHPRGDGVGHEPSRTCHHLHACP